MRNNAEIEAAINELEKAKIIPKVEHAGKHIRILWQVDGKNRQVIVSKTPSDYRGSYNARAQVRRLLKLDQVFLKATAAEIEKVKSIINETPPAEISTSLEGKVAKLESDVVGILDMLVDIQERLNMPIPITINLNGKQLNFDKPKEPKIKKERIYPEKGKTEGRVLSCLSYDKWTSLDILKRALSIKANYISVLLWKLKKEGKVENKSRAGWRLKSHG